MQCVILAGGMATRLGKLTEERPKALLEFSGRPFCDWQLDLLQQHGVTEVVFCIGHFGHQLREHFRSSPIPVKFVDEGKELMGTGGALRKAYDSGVLHERFMMIYGDSFLPLDYATVFKKAEKREAPVLLTVIRNEGKWDASNAKVEGGYVKHYKKGTGNPDFLYIDYGLAVFDRKVLERIPPNEKYDLARLYEELSLEGQLMACEVFERFYEVGSVAGIQDFQKYIETTLQR